MVNKKKVVFKYENKLKMKKKNICDLYIYIIFLNRLFIYFFVKK